MKKDIKYIIKRVLIGVLITLIISIIFKANAFAEEFNICLNSSSISCNNNQTYTKFSFISPYSNNRYNLNSDTQGLLNYIIMYDENINSYFILFFINNPIYNVDTSNVKMFKKYSDGEYVYWYGFKCLDENDISCSDNDGYRLIGGFQNSFVLSNNDSLNSSLWGGYQVNLYNSPIQNEYIYKGFYNGTLSNEYVYDNFSNFDIYSSNLNSFSIENNEIYDGSFIIPSGYSEIDLSNKSAVYFIPKNYSTISYEIEDYVKFVDFPFYYKGKINRGYFNLYDNSQIVFTPFTENIDSSENEYKYVNASFPLYYGNHNFDLSAYIIFNNGSDTKVVYNSIDFDYYIVDDIKNYNNNVCFYDDENNEKCVDINFNKTLQEIWEQGFDVGGDNFINENSNVNQFIDLLKLPFDFINSLNNTSCSSLSLTIPFLNYTFSLPCLSSIFQSFLGNYYSVIQILISGLLLYKVFLINFYAVLDVIKPQNSQVEVVDL